MTLKTLIYGLCLLGFGALLFIFPTPPSALACIPTFTPEGFPGFSPVDYVNQAQVIVEGTITAVEYRDNAAFDGYAYAAVIDVHQTLKGSETESIYIRGFGVSTACLIEARVGRRGIFYATRNTYGNFWIFRLEGADASSLTLVEQAIEQSHAPETSLSVTSSDNTPLLLALFGVGLIALLAFIFWSTKKSKRAPQP